MLVWSERLCAVSGWIQGPVSEKGCLGLGQENGLSSFTLGVFQSSREKLGPPAAGRVEEEGCGAVNEGCRRERGGVDQGELSRKTL